MAYNPEEDIKVSDLPEKTTNVVSDDKLLVIDSEDANILKQVDASKVWWWWSGTWDMLKSVYDTNNNGIVDNSEALWWFPASDYAKSADTQAKLESGVNIKTINWNSILWDGNIEIGTWWTISIDNTMSDTSENAVQNKVIKAYVDSQSGGTVDTTMSDVSTNAVQNKVIKEYVDGKWVKVFALTGSYSSNGRLTTEDFAIVKDAVDYYLAWWFPLIQGAWDWFFYPYYVYSNTSASFKKSGIQDYNGEISQRTINVYSNSANINFDWQRQESNFWVIGETQIDDLDELTFTLEWYNDNYAVKTIFQFTITIKQGNTVVKRYNWISLSATNGWKSMQRYLGWNEAYTKYKSQNSSWGIFNLNDSTNRWSMKCYLTSNWATDKKLHFVDKNKTQSWNSIFIEWILFFNY